MEIKGEKRKILKFFSNRKNKGYTAEKIAKKFNISLSKANRILVELWREGLLSKVRFGIRVIYFCEGERWER